MGPSSRLAALTAHLGAQPTPHAAPAAGGRFVGKAVVVTGAGGAIGRAAALQFAAEGASVLCVDIDGDSVGATVRAAGQLASVLVADVGAEADAERIVSTCVERYGRIDAYFANAGYFGQWKLMHESTPADFEKAMRVNVVAPFLAIKHASAAMKRTGGGSIVVTTSIAADRVDIAPVEYSASKGAAHALVRACQGALISDKVRVNALAPGGVRTPMSLGVGKQLAKREFKVRGFDPKRYPLQPPAEIAGVAVWLCSPESAPVKGQVVVADGAWTNSTGVHVVPAKGS
eukprot:TRINITY_DN70277_c0_g1_i1.p1 TRINITY_DN70277_c0_g1~~TRINITY_DN70277_c0_g1_i1.p1  ORF type:complete len:309 (+),score=76.10 TRINITY_DN70277_c0_g1_i1:65-928(+)